MSKTFININTDDLVIYTNKLEKIGKSDLPIAIRRTLNNLAFRMKGIKQKGEIEKEAEKQFDYKRNKTLFRAMTGVEKAKGLNIKSMKSRAGIINRSGRTELAKGLAQQQKGGKLESKSTPLKSVRTGKNIGKKVRKRQYYQNLGNPVLIGKKRGKRFNQLAIRAMNKNRPISVTGKKGDHFIGIVKGIKKDRKNIQFKVDWVYRQNKNETIQLKQSRPFINKAGIKTLKFSALEFEKEAKKRITKTLG